MAITVQMQFESAVTEMYQDAFVGSSIENGTTVIQFDLRKHDFQQEVGTKATLCWRKESYQVDVHELSTFHNPMPYRFIVAQGVVFQICTFTGKYAMVVPPLRGDTHGTRPRDVPLLPQ